MALSAPFWFTPLGAVWAQEGQAGAERPLTVSEPCPATPEVLVKYRAVRGEPPTPTAQDRETYNRYLQILQANDWAYLCRYRDENPALAGARPRVVLIGDSITENWKQRDPSLFVDGVVDRGISGQTSPQMVLRFYQDVIALRPRVVHIMAGTNDIAGNTGPTRDEQFQNNIKAMVDLAQAHGIKVILASIPPAKAFYSRPGVRPAERIRAWNVWLRAYAVERGLTFVDYYPVLADPEGGLKPELGGDGVHPSRAGYERMDPLFTAALVQAEPRR
ncbi:SGNH/GDSL hydrolase family protein [Caulobacter soli]|uniref:SGNH/GDSL hydrolase family protein n=1 Tax=Caulobacter soli TaxID=2708539 RepID=UPI00196AFD8B|nr:SGNH/GDSL hydrolase family protein [Caulobacter soli]